VLIELLIVATLFFATLLRSTFGIGDALVAMPLLALAVGLPVATPLVALCTFSMALAVVVARPRDVDLRALGPYLISAMIGIPLGVLALRMVPEGPLLTGLGVLLVLFGLYRLFGPALPGLVGRGWSLGLGLASGALGGAYNTHGPPLVLFGSLRRWSAPVLRASAQGYSVVVLPLVLAAHALGGLWTREVWIHFLYALPAVLLAVPLGGLLNRRLDNARFDRVLDGIIVLLGAVLIFA
jgi:uncharacterized membrane protein YfcA